MTIHSRCGFGLYSLGVPIWGLVLLFWGLAWGADRAVATSTFQCGYSTLDGSYYDFLKMNAADRERLAEISKTKRPAGLKPQNRDDMLRIRSVVEDSYLSEREKIALLQGFESFGKHGGVIRIDPYENPYHSIEQIKGRYFPVISLKSMEDLGEGVSLHELDHFRALRDVVRRIMKPGGISQNQAYRKLTKLRNDDPILEGLLISWLERRALKAEGTVLSDYYPHTEKMRRWAQDSFFVSRAAVAGSSARERVIEAVKELAVATDPRSSEELSAREKWVYLNQNSLRDFRFPTRPHWQTPNELRLLETIKDIFNREIMEWRLTRFRKSALLHRPAESQVMEKLIEKLDGSSIARELLHASKSFPELWKVISNYEKKPVEDYVQDLKKHLLHKTFPNHPERVEGLLPELAEGIFSSPDFTEKIGKDAFVDQFILRRLLASSDVSEDVIVRFAKSPLVNEYLARGNFSFQFPRLKRIHESGVDVRQVFWENFEYFLRTEDMLDVMAFAKLMSPRWRMKAKEVLLLDLEGRSESEFEWVFRGWRNRYEKKFQESDSKKVVSKLFDELYREAKSHP